MNRLLLSFFEKLNQSNLQYCVMRDGARLHEIADKDEVDLLVCDKQLGQVRAVLTQLGFVPMPNWGHAPHHFFVAYEPEADQWVKLDIVTAIVFGKPIRALQTDLATECLARRQPVDQVFVPAPECELITLLLHCVLDKGYIAEHHAARLQTLRQQITDEAYLTSLLQHHWLPTMPWAEVAAAIDASQWTTLLAASKPVASRLTQRNPVGTVRRQVGHRVLRKLNTWVNARRPRSLTVALLAPDGAGKSTLTDSIRNSFYFPVRSVYMGLYQKKKEKKVGFSLAKAGLLGNLFTQWGRYSTARYHQARRRLVVFDRYTYDALLSARQPQSRLKQWRRWLLVYTCPAPDLVILLDAPGEILFARKGEHSATLLEQQRQQYLSLQPQLRQMVVVDATQDPEQVRRDVMSLIWRGYAGANSL